MAKPFSSIPEVPFPRHWLLGHTKAFAASTLGFVEQCIAEGLSMGRARIAFKDFVFLLDPELVQHVLQKQHRNYPKSFAYEGLRHFLGNGLLTSEGEQWKKNRRAMQPGFHRAALAEMEQRMQANAERFVEELGNNGAGRPLQPDLLDLTRAITSDCLFGEGLLDRNAAAVLDKGLRDLRQYANDRLKNPFLPPRWVPVPANRRFHQGVKGLRSVVLPLIAKKHQQGPGPDLLTMLLDMDDSSSQQVYEEVVTLFVAGQETTTNALAFTLYLLWKHPEIRERLQASLAADEDDYLEAVIKESMRLYPPAWALSREALETDVLGGHEIPAGTTAFLSIYALQRHPDFWPEPDTFEPERWLGVTGTPKAYYPFGFGPRLCIGNHFAMLEMKIVLKEVVQQLAWNFPQGQSFDLVTPMTLNFKENLVVDWKKR